MSITEYKEKVKEVFANMKQEGKEFKEMTQLIKKYTKDGTLTKEEFKFIKNQVQDGMKIIGMSGVFLCPGGSILMPLIIKYAKEWDIDVLPSAFKK